MVTAAAQVTAVAQVQSLAQELPSATDLAKKRERNRMGNPCPAFRENWLVLSRMGRKRRVRSRSAVTVGSL